MTVIRKRSGDKGGCCNPYSELQLEIERVDQTAIDAKTIANNAEATINANMGKINDAIAIAPQVETNTANISQHENRINTNTTNINKNTIDIQEQDKDITALKTKTIQNENRINTNTTNINKNTTDIQKQGEDIVALKTKTNDNSAAIKVLEDEVGPETVAGTIQYRLKNIDTKLPTAIKEVEMVADASTVTHKATHISGTAESDALPVVSRTQAGIMSASVYAAMEDVIANNTSRISVLEQSALTYDISGLVSADPTNAEISAAFQQKYPNIPIQPGIRVADYNNAHFWQYGNNMWILLTQINIQTATNDSLGTVKGSNTNGKVFVETDGSMSLKGYDALVSKDATHDSKISTLETGLGNANARIDATNTNVANNAADIVAANGNISTNTNDINGLKGRMATAEGQIATHETKITQHTQSINGLTTDVNAIKTNKQDKLIAGTNITIGTDGKTISASGGKEYTAGEGINISADGIISTKAPTEITVYSPVILYSKKYPTSVSQSTSDQVTTITFGTGKRTVNSYSIPTTNRLTTFSTKNINTQQYYFKYIDFVYPDFIPRDKTVNINVIVLDSEYSMIHTESKNIIINNLTDTDYLNIPLSTCRNINWSVYLINASWN